MQHPLRSSIIAAVDTADLLAQRAASFYRSLRQRLHDASDRAHSTSLPNPIRKPLTAAPLALLSVTDPVCSAAWRLYNAGVNRPWAWAVTPFMPADVPSDDGNDR